MAPVSQPDRSARSGTSVWSWRSRTPFRRFLSTEAGSSAVLLAAAIVALVWANVAGSSYVTVWDSELSVRAGAMPASMSAAEWINSGLMVFFFFVVGLEARREFDVGDLRERRRVLLPVAGRARRDAGVGRASTWPSLPAARRAHGWGVAMSTDTAFALGLLALVGPRFPEPLRAFLLTVVIIDDLVALAVIATVYTETSRSFRSSWRACCSRSRCWCCACTFSTGVVYLRSAAQPGWPCTESGVDPVVVGLALGLLDLRATRRPRTASSRRPTASGDFREQPTP